MPRVTAILLMITWLALMLPSWTSYADIPTDSVLYLPPVLQVTDPELQKTIEQVDLLYRNGDDKRAIDLLHHALNISIARSLRSDKAVLEDRIARYYVLQADLEDAKTSLLHAEEDSLSLHNQVLQAHVLAELSSVARTYQVPTESLSFATRAIDLARSSKNLWIISYCLGELGLSQLANGKPTDAQSSLQEAIQIDHLNHYAQEAGHLLWLAWATTDAAHQFDEAIRLEESSRNLAISQSNYLVFIEATTSLARGYAQRGDAKQGLLFLEEARTGLDQNGANLFQDAITYKHVMSKPLFAAQLLEALASTYQAAKQPAKAVLNWKDLYAMVSSSAIAAEAAQGAANGYTALGDQASAAEWFGLEAKAWEKADNPRKTMEALHREAYAFSLAGKYANGISILQQEQSLAQVQHQGSRQFLALLAIAEIYKVLGRKEDCYKTLRSTESLLSKDLTIPEISPNLITEMYAMLADSYADLHDELGQTIALEKETVPISRSGGREEMGILARDLESHLTALHVSQVASEASRDRDLPKALLYFELLQHYEMFKAKAMGTDYNTHLDDPIINQLLALVGQIETQTDASEILEKNQTSLGPIASGTLFSTEVFLTNYYATHNEPAKAVAAALTIWPYLHITAKDKPLRHDVQVACQLTLVLLTQQSTASSEKAKACLEAAKAFGDPDLLLSAHLIYLEAMRTASHGEDETESDTYLREHPIKNPQLLLSLANSQASQGRWQEEIETLTRTIPLLEATKDFNSLALVHSRIASAIAITKKPGDPEQLDHLLKAKDCSRKGTDTKQEVEDGLALAAFYTQEKNWDKAQEELSRP
jgi:hypothetical protein